MNQGQQNVIGGWRNQPNAGWVNQNSGGSQFRRPSQMGYQQQQQYFPPQPSVPQQYPQQYQPSPMQQGNFQPQQLQNAQQFQKQVPQQRPSLEETMQSFMVISKQNMEMTKQNFESQSATIKRLETTVGQLSGTLNQIQQQQQPGKFHGQPLQTHQAQTVTVLRSALQSPALQNSVMPNTALTNSDLQNSALHGPVLPSPALTKPALPSSAPTSSCEEEKSEQRRQPKDGEMEEGKEDKLHKSTTPYRPPIAFSNRLRNEKLDKQKVPAYVKFFKELVSNKRKFGDNEKILVSELANSIIQQPLPPKQRDPGSFVIKIALGNGKEATGMLDLGAGINLMPYSIFIQLELGDLKPTRMCLQLADRSVRYPCGIIEDVLVNVGGLIILVDFVVLEIGEVHENGVEHTLLLGRPFMATTNTLIDVKDGNIKMTVLGESVSFSVHDSREMSSVNFINECSFIDPIDGLVETVFVQEQECVDVFAGSADLEELAREAAEFSFALPSSGLPALPSSAPSSPALPSSALPCHTKLPIDEHVGARKSALELKELPANLKYVFLEEKNEKPRFRSVAMSQNKEGVLPKDVFDPGVAQSKENFRGEGHRMKSEYGQMIVCLVFFLSFGCFADTMMLGVHVLFTALQFSICR
ncbi:uncharacterized protein LOC130994276 [Salvia miltiorrhiza]|uniref:uncharacterized protein LOC130994276 n=1 Tax=Salvia miltiorrhiza TaxID=226208 RepID=UPI0025AC8C85|nr:uncharacterized protein LOC130994276 [Salvia miltiorrhiza]